MNSLISKKDLESLPLGTPIENIYRDKTSKTLMGCIFQVHCAEITLDCAPYGEAFLHVLNTRLERHKTFTFSTLLTENATRIEKKMRKLESIFCEMSENKPRFTNCSLEILPVEIITKIYVFVFHSSPKYIGQQYIAFETKYIPMNEMRLHRKVSKKICNAISAIELQYESCTFLVKCKFSSIGCD